MRICHLGDLGHLLTEAQLNAIGQVDILIVPVGGLATINATEATQVCDQVKPRVVIPVHFRSSKYLLPLAPLGKFLKGKTGVKKLETSEVEFKKDQFPSATEILALKSAL